MDSDNTTNVNIQRPCCVQYPQEKVIEKRKGPCGMEMLLGNEYLDVRY